MARKIGALFREITGHDPSSCKNILEAERIAEEAIGKQLDIREFPSDLVPTRGTIFKISDITSEKIDAMVEAELERMRKVCPR